VRAIIANVTAYASRNHLASARANSRGQQLVTHCAGAQVLSRENLQGASDVEPGTDRLKRWAVLAHYGAYGVAVLSTFPSSNFPQARQNFKSVLYVPIVLRWSRTTSS
jgi:hypothetical protein